MLARGDGPAVLLVEDDPALRELVSEILTTDGCAVVSAARPDEAVAVLRAMPIDLVLTDSCSGHGRAAPLSGAEYVLQQAGGTPVVLFTGWRISREQVLAAGFHDLIEKPFQLDDFVRRLEVLLGH